MKRGGWESSRNPVRFTHRTGHTDCSGTVCGRDLASTLTVSIIFLYKQVSLFVLLSSQTVTHMLPDEMCDRHSKDVKAAKKKNHQFRSVCSD